MISLILVIIGLVVAVIGLFADRRDGVPVSLVSIGLFVAIVGLVLKVYAGV